MVFGSSNNHKNIEIRIVVTSATLQLRVVLVCVRRLSFLDELGAHPGPQADQALQQH